MAHPIFVAGTGRSGTALLKGLIGASRHVLGLTWETHFLVARDGLIQVGREGWPPEAVEKFLDHLRTLWYRRTVKGPRGILDAGLFADVPEEDLETAIATLQRGIADGSRAEDWAALAARFVRDLLDPATRRAGAATWCEKTPANLLYVEWLWEMFPDARIVHIIRDGRDVAASMVRNRMWPITPRSNVWPTTAPFTGAVTPGKAREYWIEMLHLGRLGAARIPAGNYLEIRLEDLVAHPGLVLERLFGFLGLPLEDGILAYPLSDSTLGRWVEDLSPEETRQWAQDERRPLQLEGYPVD